MLFEDTRASVSEEGIWPLSVDRDVVGDEKVRDYVIIPSSFAASLFCSFDRSLTRRSYEHFKKGQTFLCNWVHFQAANKRG